MEAIRQIVTIPATRELRIQLPEEALAHQEAEVIVLFKSAPAGFDEKIKAIQEAASDELFLGDLKEIAEDFEYVDFEESRL